MTIPTLKHTIVVDEYGDKNCEDNDEKIDTDCKEKRIYVS